MTDELLNRRLAALAACFAFIGVVLGTVALTTNYWTLQSSPNQVINETNGTRVVLGIFTWNGLFQVCKTDVPCLTQFSRATFIICLLGVLFLLAGGLFSALSIPKPTNLRFLTPVFIFLGCVLMIIGLAYYASSNLLNYHSSRSMIAAIVFAFAALYISAFVTGRYSASERTVLINTEVHCTQKYSTTNGNGI